MQPAFSIQKNCFDLTDTLECGQVFRYRKLQQNVYEVFSQDKYAKLVDVGCEVQVFTETPQYFVNYFDLQTDYEQTVNRISGISPIMQQAAQCGKGIRILRQDLTEMIFSFIISANNNIKRIQAIVERLCQGLGEKTAYGYAFPSLQKMADAPVEFYKSIGAGYRDRYLKNTAQKLLNFDLGSLQQMSTEQARKVLLTFEGVGPKVADCILLFGMHRGDVFPVDTWLKKVYHNYFEQGHKDAQMSTFFCNMFGQDAGLCQQYLFYFQRKYRQNNENTVK